MSSRAARHRGGKDHAGRAGDCLPALHRRAAGGAAGGLRGIWAFNEYQAGRDDPFDADEVTGRLADLAEVLIPAS